MKKYFKSLPRWGLLLSLLFMLGACGTGDSAKDQPADSPKTEQQSTGKAAKKGDADAEEDLTALDFDALKEKAAGQTVNFYGWGGDEKLNNWIDDVYAPKMKEKYDVTINRVPMDIEQILSQLSGEKQAGTTASDIDMIWINGENFKTAKENDFLYGPFVDALPNYQDYVDADNVENQKDFGFPIDGLEAPFGKAQLVMLKDNDKAPEEIHNAEDFADFVKAHPGEVTYPALPDFTGSAFVRNIIYEFVDPEKFQDDSLVDNEEKVRELVQPAMDYLRDLKPYLWNEGQSFPSSATEQENMYEDGELVFHVSYGSFINAIGLEQGRYPKGSETVIFDQGTIGNTNFLAIGKNAKDKAGAMVAINEMLSPEMQLSRYENLKVLPVLAPEKLTDEDREALKKVEIGEGVIPQDELLEKRLPEMPAGLVPMIEDIWLEEVAGK